MKIEDSEDNKIGIDVNDDTGQVDPIDEALNGADENKSSDPIDEALNGLNDDNSTKSVDPEKGQADKDSESKEEVPSFDYDKVDLSEYVSDDVSSKLIPIAKEMGVNPEFLSKGMALVNEMNQSKLQEAVKSETETAIESVGKDQFNKNIQWAKQNLSDEEFSKLRGWNVFAMQGFHKIMSGALSSTQKLQEGVLDSSTPQSSEVGISFTELVKKNKKQ